MKRIYGEQTSIDTGSLKEFYQKRAVEKVTIDIDSPVVLVGDKDKSKIEAWTTFEVEYRLPLLQLDGNSRVLEIGCGTGRISKYMTPQVEAFVGIDYVKEFIAIIESRKDILKNSNTHFLAASLEEITSGKITMPTYRNFNRLIISGGVFMYINDDDIKTALPRLVSWLDEECIIYFSEPIAMEERLTLNRFYSEDLNSEYSAIYRTEAEYKILFQVFIEQGFTLSVSEEFFTNDIKARKETKQWLFVLTRGREKGKE